LWIAALAAAVMIIAQFSSADDYSAKKSAKAMQAASSPTVSGYLIEIPHTPESCLKALDDVKALGDDKLAKYSWGCMAGDHTAYLMVNAASDAEALQWVPASERGEAKLLKLNKFTPEQIESFHKSHK
jgi:hypothetical protein